MLFISVSEVKTNPALNLVLFGRGRAQKISAARAILGQTAFQSVPEPSECVLGRGDVCGRQLTLVELPDLSGKSEEEVNKDSFRCVSLCDPEGVHAFILVVPVERLTDEDKQELKIIQNTFSSRVNDFTMVLFTVKSDPKAPAVVNFVEKNSDNQELVQSCRDKYILNIKDKEQIPELLDKLQRMRTSTDELCCYTTETFALAQIDKVIQQEKLPKEKSEYSKYLETSLCPP